jgi:hypothetical protein
MIGQEADHPSLQGLASARRQRGRGSRENVALQAQLPALSSQPDRFLTLGSRQGRVDRPGLPAAFLPVGRGNPVPERLGGGPELAGQVRRITSGTDQLDHLPPEFRRVRRTCSGHGRHLARSACYVHPNGVIPPLEAVEYATPEWVDRYNHRRPFGPIGLVPPAAAEAAFYADRESTPLAA